MGEWPERRANRLQVWDYTGTGYYFVTVCTHGRRHLFGDGERAGLEPAPTNRFGEIVAETWEELPRHIAGIRLDKFVVMPNHVHGIVVIEPVGAGSKPAPSASVSEVMRQFKTFSARKINAMRGTPGIPVWQRSYYDHIIRNEADYLRIWEYIDTNPAKWAEDEYYGETEGTR